MSAVPVAILAVLGFPVLVALGAMWKGYVLAILWAWFMVPLFGLPPLSIPMAIGFALIVTMLTNQRTGREVEKKADFGQSIFLMIFNPAVFLLIGWIVQKFV